MVIFDSCLTILSRPSELIAWGNPSLITSELRVTLADHAAGNQRVLMNLADELLTVAADRELPRLDEKLFLDVFAQQPAR
jgi:general secretion pathway protein A